MKALLKTTTALVLVSLAFAPIANAADSGQDFVKNASVGNEFEIESSKLALQKSQNDDVKQFAQQMIDDHSDAAKNMTTALKSSNVDSSLATTTLDPKHQKLMDKLNADSGSDFDKDYIKDQKAAHKDAVKLFKSYSKNGDDASLKDFATKTLPTLKEHMEHVKELKAS